MRLLDFALGLAAFLVIGASVSAQDIGGSYEVQGTNFDGSPYGGTAVITITSDVTCAIDWTTGSTTSTGICMRSGEVLAAGYDLGGKIGMIIYRLRKDGSLDGTWTIAGADGVGTEVLTPY